MSISLDFKWPLAKTLACAFVAGSLFLGARGLYHSTEGRYAECARQTMETGHWLDPVLNGRSHWTKPPLTYLAIMGTMKVAGVNTWTARAFLIPSMLLAIFGVWLLGRHLGNDLRLGEMSALVFATSAFPLAAGTVISTDFPLTTLLILAQAFFWRAIRTSSTASVFTVWFLMGLAFMTKGPPSLLVLPAMVATWFLMPREQRKAVRLFNPGALALYLVVAGTWYVWEVLRNPGLLQYWLHDEVINRSLTNEFNRNPQFYMNFVFYVPVLLFGCWPWGGWLMYLHRKAWLSRLVSVFGGSGFRGWSWSALRANVRQWPLEKQWSVLAFGLPLLVFFLSRSKLPLYVLPLFGPLSVFIAAGLLRAFSHDSSRLWKWATVLALSVWTISSVAKGVMPFIPNVHDMKVLHAEVMRQVPGLRPERLAVIGNKPLNGLQFYFQKGIASFEAAETSKIEQWAKSLGSGEKFIISRAAQKSNIERCVQPAPVTFSRLSDIWVLAHVAAAPE